MFETPDPTETVEIDTEPTPEPESEGEPQPEVEQPQKDPKKGRAEQRIQQLLAEKKALEARMLSMQVPQSHVFDEETDSKVRQIVHNDPMARQLQSQLLEIKIRNANPDYDEHFEDMSQTFQELAQEGFGGEKTAQLVLDAIRARKGVYTAQGAKQATQQQVSRAAAASPTGGAPSKPEKSPLEEIFDGSVKHRAAREAYYDKVKRGQG